MTQKGMWFKVEAYGFIPEGGELKTGDDVLKKVAEGIGELGFAAVNNLSVAVMRE